MKILLALKLELSNGPGEASFSRILRAFSALLCTLRFIKNALVSHPEELPYCSLVLGCFMLPAQKAEGQKGRAVHYFSNGAFCHLGTALNLPHAS